MLSVMRTTWPLFMGLALIMAGYGLQNILIGLRAEIEGFSTLMTGVIMSAFYAGYLAGSQLVPKMISNVGHVRVFAALASLSSTVVLLYALLVEPVSWTLMRLVGGFTIAGLYVVSESWLNDRATNETRGQILALYMMVCLGGITAGQFMANAADVSGSDLFIYASILLSLALIPMLLRASKVPDFGLPTRVSIAQLYRTSPLGVIGTIGCGASHAVLLTIAPVYAASIGMSVAKVSMFTAAIFLGAMVLTFILGRISDRFDRRQSLTVTTFLATLACLVAMVIGNIAEAAMLDYALIASAALIGGLIIPIYSFSVAHTNDYLQREQMVAATGTIYLLYGVGSVIGPFMATSMMETMGPAGFFVFLGVVHAGIGFFAVWRMTQRKALPIEEQGPSVYASTTGTYVAGNMIEEVYAEEEGTGEEPQEEEAVAATGHA